MGLGSAAKTSIVKSSHGLGLKQARHRVPMVMTIRPAPVGGARFVGNRMKLGYVKRPGVLGRQRRCKARRTGGVRVVAGLFEKFTEKAIKVLLKSQNSAKTLGHIEVQPYHIFWGLVEQDTSKNGFMGTGLKLEEVKSVVEAIAGKETRRTKDLRDIPFSHEAKELLEQAEQEAKRMDAKYVCEDHLVIALMSKKCKTLTSIFMRLGLNTEALAEKAAENIAGDQALDRGESPKKRGKAVATGSTKGTRKGDSVLDELCRDLCEDVRQGKIDPIIGRKKEIQRVMQILARRRKNNPVLLGEAGVGKTAIAEGIAYAIVTGLGPDGSPIPEFLKDMRVMQLDVALLMAGAKERGELEKRVTSLVQEVSAAPDVILMIDEVHTLVGAGAVGRSGLGSGGLDIANMIKPALARGDLQCIGATTMDEYRLYVESDKALARRFQPVDVPEPSPVEAIKVVEGLQRSYEKHHKCLYTPEAVQATVALSCRYIADRQLPDKAIDLLDEAGSSVRIASYNARRQKPEFDNKFADEVWNELNQVVEAKYSAARDGLFEEAALLRIREIDLQSQISGPAEDCAVVPVVDVGDVEAVVASWSGVPVEKLSAEDEQKFISLEESLRSEIIGQDLAVSAVSRAMCRASSLIRDPNRPIASFLFCGPTGVGKTELTKVLADHCFGSRDSIIRLDMSEYMERFSVSKLIGAPPGYVGYGEGGKLTEPIRRKPYSVVLLDEVEKAHPDVFNMLLQILEDGRLTDSQGRTVSFKNALVIMTSNIGSNAIAKGGSQIGFQLEDDQESREYSRVKSLVNEELKTFFRPEMLNRIDEIIVFEQLGLSDIYKIADIVLKETAELLLDRGIGVRVTQQLKEKICRDGYDSTYGARPLRREIMRVVNDGLCDAILQGEIVSGDVALLDVGADGSVVLQNRRDLAQEDFNDVVVYPMTSSVEASVET